MVKTIVAISLILISVPVLAQDDSAEKGIPRQEAALAALAPDIIHAPSDSQRFAAAHELHEKLEHLLNQPETWVYPFDSLKKSTISILTAPDDKFRIFTFNVIDTSGNYYHFGLLQVHLDHHVQVYSLVDTGKRNDSELRTKEYGPEHWPGALYYDIVPFGIKKEICYLLVGYDGNTVHSNKKILDVLWFDNGDPVFGKELFLEGPWDKAPEYRAVFEFHNDSRMLLRYEPKYTIVVLDKLAPAFPEVVNQFSYYIPSGDYDFYAFKKGYWVRDALNKFNFGQGKQPDKPGPLPSPSTDPGNPDFPGGN